MSESYDDFDSMIDNIELTLKDLNITTEDKNILDSKKNECCNCFSDDIVDDSTKSYKVCGDCGMIQYHMLDNNPEYSGEGAKDDCSRYGCPTNHFYPKASLGTKITSKTYSRIMLLHNQGQMPYRERSLYNVLDKIQKLCTAHTVSQNIIDNAKILYNKIYQSKHIKGKNEGKNIIMRCLNRASLIAGCVFFGAKLQGESLTNKKIAEIFDLETKHVNKGCRKIFEYLDLTPYNIKSSQSSDFIERYSKILGLKQPYISYAKDIASNIHKLNIASTNEPPSVAASSILLMAKHYDLNITNTQVSDIFNISIVTINKTLDVINAYEQIVTSNEYTEKILFHANKTSMDDNNNEELVIL
jgi:transcription initiation factor TFIIIB Brf1 subunit/transcription initiation factor TFIIB